MIKLETQTVNIIFRDVLSYTAPTSLKQYLQMHESSNSNMLKAAAYPFHLLRSEGSLKAHLPVRSAYVDPLSGIDTLNQEYSMFQQVIGENGGDAQKALNTLGLKAPPQTGDALYAEMVEFWGRMGFQTLRDLIEHYAIMDVLPLAQIQHLLVSIYLLYLRI